MAKTQKIYREDSDLYEHLLETEVQKDNKSIVKISIMGDRQQP